MDNNDLLIRLRYALDIKNMDMVAIFKLGGIELSKDEVLKVLTKTPESEEEEDGIWIDREEDEDYIKAEDSLFEAFLNGFIIFKRGRQDPKPNQADLPEPVNERSNNLLLKKVKIALQLNSEDMLEIWDLAGVTVTKGELGALLRKTGHKNYKECGDRYARNFLKGLAIKYRN